MRSTEDPIAALKKLNKEKSKKELLRELSTLHKYQYFHQTIDEAVSHIEDALKYIEEE